MTDFSYATNVVGTIEKTDKINMNAVTGYTPALWDIIVRRYPKVSDTGASASERSAWSIAGATDAKTTNIVTNGISKQVLYLRITGTTDAVVKLYTATGGSGEVAGGTHAGRATGGVLALTESNSSGITGSVTLADACTNVTDAVLYLEESHDRYDGAVDAALDNIVGIYYPLDSDSGNFKTVIQEADNVVLRRLGKDGLTGEIGLEVLRKNLVAKNIRTI
jgi:hypothetical protein